MNHGFGKIERFDLRGLIRNSLLEWDDHIAAVAIAGGCNWRCPFCHSWRYVTGLADLEARDVSELFELLDNDTGWIDGVVVTGGEPTLQPGLPALLQAIRHRRRDTKLHTNGSRPDVIEQVVAEGLVDCLALDLKAPLDRRLAAAAGIEMDEAVLATVRRSFALAREAPEGVAREYHTTLCPAYVDEAMLADMGEWLAPGGTWILQNYEPDDVLNNGAAGERRYMFEELTRLEAAARSAYPSGKVVLRRGRGA